MENFFIGCHLSSSKGFVAMLESMQSLGGTSFQYFSRNPRGSAIKALDLNDIAEFNRRRSEMLVGPIICHAPYTLNPAGQDQKVLDFARQVLDEDIARLSHTPNVLYNFHPGSHVGQGIDKGIMVVAETLNRVLDGNIQTKILLEGMSGKGTEVGGRFEHLAAIIERVERKELMGVCLDSCHLHDAGYDIVGNLDGVLKEFDEIVGLDRLHAMHLNDSKNTLGTHRDRHEKIGAGHLGLATFEALISHPKLRQLPFVLETPNELEGYAEEIALLKGVRRV